MKLNRRLGVSTAGILEPYLGDYRGRNGTQLWVMICRFFVNLELELAITHG